MYPSSVMKEERYKCILHPLLPGSELVTDPDEEIFILYSELQATPNSRGLGCVDSHKDVLDIKFEFKEKKPKGPAVVKTVEIELFQDKTALRTRKGDTGSVLWKASIDVGQLILQQYYCSDSTESLLDRRLLETQHVLELGSGTGLLSIALTPLVCRYTATDIKALIPLIRKNMTLNFPGWPNISESPGSNIVVEELDWQLLESTPISQRAKFFNFEPVDLLLVVDCIYHPSLLSSLVTTIDYLSIPGKTTVLIISELRAEDVMREFMETWLSKPGWEIWRIPNDALGKHYAIWMGRKPLVTLAETTKDF